MSRRKKGNMATATRLPTTAELGSPVPAEPAPVEPPKNEQPKAYRFQLRSAWMNPYVTVEGAKSEQEARDELHKCLDAAIVSVQLTR